MFQVTIRKCASVEVYLICHWLLERFMLSSFCPVLITVTIIRFNHLFNLSLAVRKIYIVFVLSSPYEIDSNKV